MINLEKIHILNFRAFREKEFDFKSKPLILLTAPNGFGKTSLVDAIEWCFTGTVKRLEESYVERKIGDTDAKNLKKGLILNSDESIENANVTLTLNISEESGLSQMVIQRTTTVNDLGCENTKLQVKYQGKVLDDDDAKITLEKFLNIDNYYKYHICDVQKTFRFLSQRRKETNNFFADFITNYDELDTITKNLGDIYEQLRIERNEATKSFDNVDKKIKELDVSIEEFSKRSNLIDYDKSCIIYDDENLDINNLSKDGLENQLQKLYLCLIKIVADFKSEISVNNKKTEMLEKINEIISELQTNGVSIKRAIDSGFKTSDLTEARNRLAKYEEMQKITEKTFPLCYNELLSAKPVSLDTVFISECEDNKKCLKEELDELVHQIEVASEGNEIMKLFSELLSKKDVIVEYRAQKKSLDNREIVYCPICGSKEFDTMPYEEILARAKEYCNNQNTEIAKKSAEKADRENKINEIWVKELTHINMALKEVIASLEKRVSELSKINVVYSKYLEAVKDFNDSFSEKLVFSKITIKSLKEKSEQLSKEIKSEEDIEVIKSKIKAITDFMLDHAEETSIKPDSTFSVVKKFSEKAPIMLNCDIELIFRKIVSIRTHLDCKAYVEQLDQKQKQNETAKSLRERIDYLDVICKTIYTRIADISKARNDKIADEYNDIFKYLYNIFIKLCKNTEIKMFTRDIGRSQKDVTLTIKDGDGNPIQNIMSDGQLSVFMLSVFFSNAKRIVNDKNNSEKFHCYFIDDITSCMDDINMLAFVDFVKYQTSGNNRCMDQLFFSTCDARIRKLIMYKCEMAGIDFCEISSDKFD